MMDDSSREAQAYRQSTRMARPPTYPELRLSQLIGPGRWRDIASASCLRFAYSGRASIYQCMVAMRTFQRRTRRVVLVPAYHCPTVVDPILHAGLEPRFFSIDDAMNVDPEDFLRKLDQQVAGAIFIRYFGFQGDDAALRQACRDAGAWVIEDCSHSFLEAAPVRLATADADVEVYSFWKLLPTLIGGALRFHNPEAAKAVSQPRRIAVRDSLSRLRVSASQLRSSVFHRGGSWSALPNEAEPKPVVRIPYPGAYPYDPHLAECPIPGMARWILERADLQDVVDARRRNYTVLADALAPARTLRPLRPHLGTSTCPWGFPLLMDRRDRHDYLIRARGVPVFTFGEVLHPSLFERHRAEVAMLDRARNLSDNVMGIAVQQDIDAAMMGTIATIINEFTSAS